VARPDGKDRAARRPPGPSTRAVHGPEERTGGPMSTPIVHSATFRFPDLEAMNAAQAAGPAGAFYQRYGHPTLRACEERLAALEGAETALLFSSGMAAITAAFASHLKAGDHVVSLRQCYGGTTALLAYGAEHFGWAHDLADAREPDGWERAFKPNTRILHVESPTNPTLTVVDLARAAALAHAHDALLTVDNTFASPVGQHPLALGADLVMHSATKSIGGHADLLAGVVLGARARLEPVWKARKVLGPVPDPTVAWQIERSLKTLPLRVRAANASALALAQRLIGHPAIAAVYYPGLADHPGHVIARRQMPLGFGPVLAFEVRALGLEPGAAATEVVNRLELICHAPSLGGVESLASLPAHTSHVALGREGRAAAGISEDLVRVSVGIEDLDDLWADLEQALAPVAARAPAARG
jgi:cystathionine gamma-synthase